MKKYSILLVQYVKMLFEMVKQTLSVVFDSISIQVSDLSSSIYRFLILEDPPYYSVVKIIH